MSIIPGIETAAPERTETSSGSLGSPKRFPVCSSSARDLLGDLVLEAVRELAAARMYSTQASVVTVKPAGTGIPIAVISARPTPLPPSSSRPSPPPVGRSRRRTEWPSPWPRILPSGASLKRGAGLRAQTSHATSADRHPDRRQDHVEDAGRRALRLGPREGRSWHHGRAASLRTEDRRLALVREPLERRMPTQTG